MGDLLILSNKSSGEDWATTLPLDSLTTFEKVERYGKAKANNKVVVEYLAELLDRDEFALGMVNPLIEKIYLRMDKCASWLTFREYTEHKKVTLRQANFCSKHLLCQACAIRRGAQILQSYMPKIEHVMQSEKLTPWLITFTVKNGECLGERFKHLECSMKSILANRKNVLAGSYGYAPTELSKVSGGVFAFEVPKSKDGEEWHPHLHMLALCTTKPEVGHVDPKTGKGFGLRKEWFDITGDSFQVDVRRQEGQEVINMACEVMKYAVKFSQQEPADTWKAFQTLNRKRLLRSFGCLYGVQVPDSMLDAPLSGPYIDRMFTYVGGGHYSAVSVCDMRDHYEAATS